MFKIFTIFINVKEICPLHFPVVTIWYYFLC